MAKKEAEKQIKKADWYRFMCYLAGKTPSAKRIRDYRREEGGGENS